MKNGTASKETGREQGLPTLQAASGGLGQRNQSTLTEGSKCRRVTWAGCLNLGFHHLDYLVTAVDGSATSYSKTTTRTPFPVSAGQESGRCLAKRCQGPRHL